MLDEHIYLLVITYADGSNWTWETYSLEEAKEFMKNYDHLYSSYAIYDSIIVSEHLYGD